MDWWPLTVRQGGALHYGAERPVHVHAVGLYRKLVFGEWLQPANEDVFPRAAKARNVTRALRHTLLAGQGPPNLLPYPSPTGATNTMQRTCREVWMYQAPCPVPKPGPSSRKHSWINPHHSLPKGPSLMLLFLDLILLQLPLYISISFYALFPLPNKPLPRSGSLSPHLTGDLSGQQLGCLFPVT